LLEEKFTGEVGPALVTPKAIWPARRRRGFAGWFFGARLVAHKPDKNDVKKRATSSRALHFFE
jgi:hypothetical protein